MIMLLVTTLKNILVTIIAFIFVFTIVICLVPFTLVSVLYDMIQEIKQGKQVTWW